MSMLTDKASDRKSDKPTTPKLVEHCVSVPPKIPKEAWFAVFEKLGVKDQLMCLRTCPEWGKWFSHKRTRLLLPRLAPLVLDQLDKCGTTSEMLCLRMVCKSWKEAVDHFYAHYRSVVRFNDFQLEAEDDLYLGLQVTFNCNEDIQGFMEDMKSHQGNPFPGRIIELWPKYEPANTVEDGDRNLILSRGYWNNANELLEKFGPYLNFCGLVINDTDFESHEINEIEGIIRKGLINLPNVKHLQVAIDSEIDQVHFFQEEALPRLFRLEALDLYVCNPELLVVLLESCCIPANIKRLRVSHDETSRIPDLVYQFVNLEVLRVAINCESDLERFQSLQQPPPLQEIQFIFEINMPEIKVIFTCLERFKNTLLHAYLIFLGIPTTEYTSKQMKTICNGLKLNLPNLKKLTLYGYNGPLDPFLQLNSLDYFEVLASGDLWEWEGSEVDFFGCENKMYESNIWGLIPSLNRFVYSHSEASYLFAPANPLVYSREVLEQYVSKKVMEDLETVKN